MKLAAATTKNIVWRPSSCEYTIWAHAARLPKHASRCQRQHYWHDWCLRGAMRALQQRRAICWSPSSFTQDASMGARARRRQQVKRAAARRRSEVSLRFPTPNKPDADGHPPPRRALCRRRTDEKRSSPPSRLSPMVEIVG